MGNFMKYLPITVSVTLAGSLFVAFIFNPVFASLFMHNNPDHHDEEGGGLFMRFKAFYGRTLSGTEEIRDKTSYVMTNKEGFFCGVGAYK